MPRFVWVNARCLGERSTHVVSVRWFHPPHGHDCCPPAALPRVISRSRQTALTLGLFAASSALPAQEADPAKDALIVETLLRLDHFDLDAKPKTKAAVLRFLQANPGSEPILSTD